jgi:hypothetical protein
MSAELTDPAPEPRPGLGELRAEVARLRAEVDDLRNAQPDQVAGSGFADQQAAQLTGSSIIASPIVAGQYNTAEAATILQATTPTITLGLLNQAQGTATTGAPVGLYSLVRGVGAIISAYGTPPYPATSKAVQAFCEQGVAIFADSRDDSAVYAHTTNGNSAIVADQGNANPRGVAVVALGGQGIGVYASGTTAAVQLGKAELAGPPTVGFHEAGELVLDAGADLYLCKASGTPGIWKLIG